MQNTRRSILEYLRDHGAGTVDTLSDAVELAPVTVRHHLGVLRKRGLVVAGKQSVGRGRPRHVFTLTAPGAELLIDDGYEALASRLIDQIKMDEGASAQHMFARMADDILLENGAQLDGSTMEERLDFAALVLGRQGYTTHWESDGDEFIVRQLGCPFHSLASRHHEVCSMDLRLVAEATGAKVVREDWRQDGAPVCTMRVIPPNGKPVTRSGGKSVGKK